MRTPFRHLITLAITLCAIPQMAQAGGYLTSVGEGLDKIPVVVVWGSPFEMGRKNGELMKADATELVDTFLTLVQAADPERFSNQNLDAAWKKIAPHTDPRFIEELRGLAEGSGIPIEKLRRAHVMPVIADYSCSGIAAWGPATKSGHRYQPRNLDWDLHVKAQDHPCIVIYHPDEGVAHANITFAGCIGSNTGMNANGIVLSEMGDSPGKEYPFNIDGTHFTTLFRTVLYDADGLDKAVGIFKDAHRIKKYHFVVGDGKNKQAVKMKAHAPDLVIWKDNDPEDELAPNIMPSVVYQDEGRGAFKPLQKVYGQIGHQEMIDIACKIPIKGGNVLDVVYDATALEFWVAYAEKEEEAYKRPFVHVRMKDYVKRK